jgi:hypothetical protein
MLRGNKAGINYRQLLPQKRILEKILRLNRKKKKKKTT